MSNQDKNMDELRDLLRKKLEATAADEDGWNVPSKSVWLGLSEELAADKRSRSSGNTTRWLTAAVVALLALLFFRECSHNRQMNNLKTELRQAQNSCELLRRDCDEKSATVHAGQTKEDADSPLTGLPAPSIGSVTSPLIYVEEKGLTSSQIPAPDTNTITGLNSNLFPAEKNNSESDSLETNTAGAGSEQPRPLPPPAIPTAFIQLETHSSKPALHLPGQEKNSIGLDIAAFIFGGAALTGNRLTGEKPGIIARQKTLWGWQTGAGIEAAFHRRWSLQTSLRYGIHRIETDYALAVPYTHNGEMLHDDGNYDNQYNHSLPSSLGDYPLQMVLTRESSANVEEGEVMRLDLNIRQRIRQLSLPVYLRYGFGKHRWQAGLLAGLSVNHILDVHTEDSPELISHHGAIHQRHTLAGDPSNTGLQKFTLDASLGLDFRYLLSGKTSISLGTGWQRAITPVYEGEQVRNYLQSFVLSAGVHVRLH